MCQRTGFEPVTVPSLANAHLPDHIAYVVELREGLVARLGGKPEDIARHACLREALDRFAVRGPAVHGHPEPAAARLLRAALELRDPRRELLGLDAVRHPFVA